MLRFVLVGAQFETRSRKKKVLCSCYFRPSFCRLTRLVFVCGPRSRKMGGWLSRLLRCIVVKATQVLESGLVAELVLVLCGNKNRLSDVVGKKCRTTPSSVCVLLDKWVQRFEAIFKKWQERCKTARNMGSRLLHKTACNLWICIHLALKHTY